MKTEGKLKAPDWLARICNGELGSRERPYTHQPWTLQIDGEPWTIATNGHIAVQIRGDLAEPAPESIVKGLIGATTPPEGGTEVQWSTLRKFVGSFDEDCDDCMGTGLTIEVCDLDFDHEVVCDCRNPNHAWIGDALVDLNMARGVVKHLKAETVTVTMGNPTGKDSDAWRTVFVSCVEWRLAWSPCMPHTKDDGAPRFELGQFPEGA